MSDALEFLEEALTLEDRPKKDKRYKSAEKIEECESSPKEERRDGTFKQYSKYQDGFWPTGVTTLKLPSGVYTIDSIQGNIVYNEHKIASDQLLRLPDSRSDELIREIELFWSLKKEFKEGNEFALGGYLHKRGYLLFGPPGSGKSCTVKLIMKGVMDLGGVVFLGNGVGPSLLARGMKYFRMIEPNTPLVVVLEDFDAMLERYDESAYLSIIDGEDSVDNVLFLGTTNYPSRLDPRIYNRPGRFSDVVKIGMPSPEAREYYLKTQLKRHDEIDKIVELTSGFSLDHLKSLILGVYFEKKNLEFEVKRLRTLFKPPKENYSASIGLGGRA